MIQAAPDPRRVAAYIRWSTEEQGQGTTLAVQQERLQWFVRSQGWHWDEELLFIDEGYSGSSLDRPALGRLRAAVRQGVVDCVVVYRLDRLSRSLLDTVNLVRREWEGRAVLCSATENFDTHSPVGQMVFNILASFAEFERSLIRDRTRSGKRKRAEQGKNAGGRYPLGYRKGPGGWELNGRDAQGRLVGPAALVRLIFERFLAGLGTGAIARALNAEGVPTPQGRLWRFHYIARILKSPIYAGRYRYASCQVEGAVEQIVTLAEWDQVQALLSGRRVQRSPGAAYLLSGLARCGRCGSALAGSRGRSRRYYVCTGRTLLHRCDGGYMGADQVEQAVLGVLRDLLPFRPDPAEGERHWAAALAQRRGSVRQLQAELAALERQRRRVEREFLAGHLTGNAYSHLVERLEPERLALQARLSVLAEGLERLEGQEPPAVPVDPWAALTFAELRQVLQLLLAELALYRPPGKVSPVQMELRGKRKNPTMPTQASGGGSPLTPAGPGDQTKDLPSSLPKSI